MNKLSKLLNNIDTASARAISAREKLKGLYHWDRAATVLVDQLRAFYTTHGEGAAELKAP